MADIEKHNPNNSSQIALVAEPLVKQLRELIENTRQRVASIVCDETTQMYWNVGNAINTFVLQGNRAEYGKQIVVSVSRQLVAEYGDRYMTLLPDKKVLEQKLQKAIAYARERMAIQEEKDEK